MPSHSGRTSLRPGKVLEVSLFGDFTLNAPDGTSITLSNRKARALLAMLCLAPGEAIERDRISALLWPGRFQAQARASLRQCLLSLGKILAPHGTDLLDISRSRIAVDPSAVRSDLGKLETALTERRADRAHHMLAAIGNKPLLDQMDFGDPFREWLTFQRQQAENRLQVAADRALTMLKAEGDAEGYRLLSKAWRARVRSAAPRAENKQRIAVLPFQQHDEIGGEFFLAEGVVEELSSGLGRISNMAVAGRTSVAAIAASGSTLPEIAAALGVSHLIEGSVHRSATDIRINLRLIDGQTGAEIWSDQVGGTIEEIMGSRQVIGGNVISGLCKALGINPTPLPRRRMTTSREAYALYLQGRALTYRAIGDGVLEKAVQLLEDALELDPDFAECWTALAEAHVFTAVYTPCLERVMESQRMVECAKKAIALNPAQGHAHAMLGIHEWTRQNPVKALDFAFEAYRLEPNNADATIRLGSFLLYVGRTREALPYIEAAIAQDPIFGRNYAMLCAAHFNLGNVEEAIAAGQRMVDLGMPGMWLATATALSGDHEAGTEIYYRSRLLMNTVILPPAGTQPMADDARDAYWLMAANGCCSGKPEDRALYCQMLDGLHATMPDPYDPSIASPAIWMGHADLVMKIYSEQIHPANMFGLMSLWADVEPIRQIRTHPDFLGFADRIGLVAAWQKYGWPDLIPDDPRTN
ncbi:MAG: hypothetical protein V2J26_07800 [Pacificimonas sp.]|jgi:TolB-like protein|nr:hypothetical protein [Pacificimonas sp.]